MLTINVPILNATYMISLISHGLIFAWIRPWVTIGEDFLPQSFRPLVIFSVEMWNVPLFIDLSLRFAKFKFFRNVQIARSYVSPVSV